MKPRNSFNPPPPPLYKNTGGWKRTALATAVSLACSPVIAQPGDDEERTILEEVFVTGSRSGHTVLESSVAITTLDEEDLLRKMPRSTADALELIPGMIVEATGGEVSNNYTVRGLAGGGQQFVQILEDGLPVKYANALVDAVLKQDLTIERVEAVRGGTSGILTVQGPSAAVNFITRRPGEEAEGSVRLTGSTYDTRKVEFYYGAPIGGDWYGSVGGYYRESDAVRDVGFTADRGGIFKALVEKRFEDGRIGFTGKLVDEHNTFLLPTPFENFDNPSDLAGFDALEGSMLSIDNAVMIGRNSVNSGAPPTSINDLTDGFATQATQLGFYFDKEFAEGVTFHINSRYIDHEFVANAVFNVDNGSIVRASDRISNANQTNDDGSTKYVMEENDDGMMVQKLDEDMMPIPIPVNADIRQLLTRFPGGSGNAFAVLQYVSSGEVLMGDALDALNGNGLVTNGVSRSPWDATREFAFDISLDWETGRNFLTVGALYFDTRFDRGENGMNTFLSEVTDNPRRLDIVAWDPDILRDPDKAFNDMEKNADGSDNEDYNPKVGGAIGYLTESSVLNYGAWGESRASESKQSLSFYVNDEFEVNDALRLDAGIRVEKFEGTFKERQGYSRVDVLGACDGKCMDDGSNDNDNIIANNHILGGTGTQYRTLAGDLTEWAWTIGGNWRLTDNFALYGRYVDAFNMRGPWDDAVEISFLEGGIRFQNSFLQTSLTLFSTLYEDQFFRTQATTSAQFFDFTGDYEVLGTEFEFVLQPVDWFALDISGVWQDAELSTNTAEGGFESVFDGNEPQRLPPAAYRLTPRIIFGGGGIGDGELYLTWQSIDDRFADVGNSVELPGYDTLAAGFIWHPNEALTLSFNVRNLTDEVGLTEGNPRGGFIERPDGTESDVFLARGIAGRNAVFNLRYDF